MFANQHKLKSLPLPSIEKSCELYLELSKPIVPPQQHVKTVEIVREFAKSKEAAVLQKFLERKRDAAPQTNWNDRYWLDGYVMMRPSTGLSTSAVFEVMMHPNPKYNQDRCVRAALATYYALEMKLLLDSQQFAADSHRGKPMCMLDYQNLFNTTRLPQFGKDTLAHFDSNHIIVCKTGHLFLLPVLDKEKKIVELGSLVATFRKLDRDPTLGETADVATSLGTYMALPREEWAQVRGRLISGNPANHRIVQLVEEAIFVVVLDEASPESCSAHSCRTMLYGTLENEPPKVVNRLWDKSIHIGVAKNGLTSITFDHTGMDSLPPLKLVTSIATREKQNFTVDVIERSFAPDFSAPLIEAEPLVLVTDDHLKEQAARAMTILANRIKIYHIDVWHAKNFGAKQLKSLGVSPDACVQMMLQVAFKEVMGYRPSSYESAGTKYFYKGRTETLRALQTESVAFLEGLEQGDPPHISAEKLRKACERHGRLGQRCVAGQGCDRHLASLMIASQELGMKLPKIFEDPTYETYARIELSTTHPNPYYGIRQVGFAPVSPKCIGVGYFIFEDEIVFSFSSWLEGKPTAFKEALQRAAAKFVDILNSSPSPPRQLPAKL